MEREDNSAIVSLTKCKQCLKDISNFGGDVLSSDDPSTTSNSLSEILKLSFLDKKEDILAYARNMLTESTKQYAQPSEIVCYNIWEDFKTALVKELPVDIKLLSSNEESILGFSIRLNVELND